MSEYLIGKVIGNLPDGQTFPEITSATASPHSCPGNQAIRIPSAFHFQESVSIMPQTFITTIIFLSCLRHAAPTLLIMDNSSAVRLKSFSMVLSDVSPEPRPNTTTATSLFSNSSEIRASFPVKSISGATVRWYDIFCQSGQSGNLSSKAVLKSAYFL